MPTTSQPYASFPHLTFEHPSDGVLRIVLDGPGLNAVGPDLHTAYEDGRIPEDEFQSRKALLTAQMKID